VSKRATPSASAFWTPRMNVPLLPFTPEYSPSASVCQMSTDAPGIGLQLDAFTTSSARASAVPGRPSVTSRRTGVSLT
jgi:hypothetical protein